MVGKRPLLIALLFASLACAACAPVRPWQRDALARPDMAWEPDPLGAGLGKHIQFSKEGSIDGGPGGGGGCGCN
jgi:hypothetical protein